MRRRKAIIQLTVFVLLAVISLGLTLRSGNTPLLGLDLQGGVSVVLSPKTQAGDEELNQAIAIMRQRIDALGVSEPEITRQGDNILVNIAGVKDTDQAIDQVGQTAELRFRPVLQVLPPEPTEESTETPPGTDVPGTTVPGSDPAATTDSVAPDPAATDTTAPSTTAAPSDTTEGALGAGAVEGESAAGGQEPPTTDPTSSDIPTETTAVDPTATTAPVDPTATTIDPAVLAQAQAQAQAQQGANLPTTPPGEDKADQIVVLPEYDADGNVIVRYQLGPTQLTGKALEGASAGIDSTGKWTVNPKFKAGAEGIDAFNAAAQVCKPASQECPTGQQAITLDGRVISAPRIQPDQQAFTPFSADQVNISGNFDQDSAQALATALRYGSLPIELDRVSTEIVSATLGLDALHAGLIAGAVGLVLAAIYMGIFYRILGMMALLKLGIEAMVLYSLVTWLGVWAGLSLTLAGVTGIIVSIGVSLDSNVVYYEHLREDVRNGRTIRSAVDRSFHASFSTILKANGASILGAALLYFLAVGPVRGFAFFLGLSTVLDLVTSYFFMRPVVFLTTSAKLCHTRPALFGLPFDAANREEATRPRPGRRAATGASRSAAAAGDDGGDDGSEPDREPAEPTGATS
jgi:preprotein translocase subunit SecD